MKREELEIYELTDGNTRAYDKDEADSVMDAMEKDYEANRKLWEAEIASLKAIAEKQQKLSMDRCFEIKALKQRIKELEEENGNLVQFEKSEKIRTDNVTEYRKVRIKVLEARNKELEYVCNSRLEEVNRFRDYLREDEERIKELEADKLRQENYCESLVNDNTRLNEIIISKDMVGAELVNENKALRHNIEDYKCDNEALKARIKELEDKVEQKNFFWEGCGLSKRGFKNTIAVSNYIEDFEARIKELEASQPKWISVKDRLPEEEKEILFTDGAYITIGEMWGYEEKYFQEKSACIWNGVTHWMPLPQPPKSED